MDSLVSDLQRGEISFRSFGNLAISVLNSVLENMMGGSLGSILGKSIGKSLGLTFGTPITSNATGIKKVPYDMTTRIHKGEEIVPRQQADKMGSDGGMVVNIDARGAGQGVENKIRQVMAEVQSLRADTPKIALNVVSDQNRRNPSFLR
jgi:outer membrane lipoprotein SlyB